jgi:sigma54-dependent transcription regulator
MNIRDYGTSWYLELEGVRQRLDDIENCIDFDEAIFCAQELSADIETIQQELDTQLELGMDEE